MPKKYLTIEDLVSFCQKQHFTKFNSKDYGYPLAVQYPCIFEVQNEIDDNHRGMSLLKVRVFHLGLNRNGSFIPEDAGRAAASTIKNRPLLASIHQLEDGTWDFKGHDFEIVTKEDGEEETNYIEKQVGSFSSEDPIWEHDNELDKDYLCAYAYVPEEYTKTMDIIRKKGWTRNSCELHIDELSYNEKEHCVQFDKFYIAASTLLGSTDDGEEIEEGMLGSRADIVDFSLNKNSALTQEQLINVMKELTEALNKYTANFAEQNPERKEEKEKLNKELFEKLCEKYSVTEEDITFEYSELDDVALTSAFAEHFDGDGGESSSSEGSGESSEDSSEVESEETSDNASEEQTEEAEETEEIIASSEPVEPAVVSNDATTNDNTEEVAGATRGGDSNDSVINAESSEDDEYDGSTDSIPSNKVKYSIIKGSEVHEFSISMNEEIAALTELVNTTYSEEDNDCYYVEVYGNEKTVVFHGWNKHFKQKYTVKDGVYTLKGERTQVYAKYLTQDEIESLEGLKAKFAETSDKLSLYESEPEKIAVLSSEDYSLIKDTNEYKELSKRENYFNLSTDELTSKLDSMLNSYAKELGKKNFSVNEKENEANEVEKKDFFAFARIKTESSFLDGLLGKK